MSTITLYPSGPPAGVDLGAAGATVTNVGTSTVEYADTAEPFVAEGTLAAAASATLAGTQFFRAVAGSTLRIVEADVALGSLEEIRASLLAVESGQVWEDGEDGFVLTFDEAGNPVWSAPASGGGTAATTTFAPAGSIAATDVQEAVEEVAAEAAATAATKALNVEAVNTVASAGATETLPDVDTATIHRVTLDAANCILTFPTAAAGKSFTLVLVQDATGSRTVTWPAVLWPSNTAPTLTTTAGKRDVFTFVCVDGTNWLGSVAGQNY